MKKIIFTLAGVLTLSAGQLARAESENLGRVTLASDFSSSYTSISETKYYVSASVPIAVPVISYLVLDGPMPTFGIGHAIQGRYGSRGWWFTVGEVVFIGATIYFAMSAVSSTLENMGNAMNRAEEGGGKSGDVFKSMSSGIFGGSGIGLMISSLGLLGFMIWEAVDVWFLPSNIKVSNSPFELSPFYSYKSLNKDFQTSVASRSLGLSLKYKF